MFISSFYINIPYFVKSNIVIEKVLLESIRNKPVVLFNLVSMIASTLFGQFIIFEKQNRLDFNLRILSTLVEMSGHLGVV